MMSLLRAGSPRHDAADCLRSMLRICRTLESLDGIADNLDFLGISEEFRFTDVEKNTPFTLFAGVVHIA